MILIAIYVIQKQGPTSLVVVAIGTLFVCMNLRWNPSLDFWPNFLYRALVFVQFVTDKKCIPVNQTAYPKMHRPENWLRKTIKQAYGKVLQRCLIGDFHSRKQVTALNPSILQSWLHFCIMTARESALVIFLTFCVFFGDCAKNDSIREKSKWNTTLKIH